MSNRSQIEPSQQTYLLNPRGDFWLLGGASIIVWAFMYFGNVFRESVGSIEQHFLQLAAAFGILNLVCNYPHFLVSYRFGYGRGFNFVIRNWFKLVFLPVSLFLMFALAYIFFDHDVSLFGSSELGTGILKSSVWLMYITVGWHYSKQVFGCMMVYAKYDRYVLTKEQRLLLKINVYSIAMVNFFYFATSVNPIQQGYFFGLSFEPLNLPSWLFYLSEIVTILTTLAVVFFVFSKNKKDFFVYPSYNFLVPWVALFVWWLPLTKQTEFYFLAIPFFHSLQYLPFAYRLEEGRSSKGERRHMIFIGKSIFLFLVGYCAFEFMPLFLDQKLDTSAHKTQWFFFISFAVFINIHHFIIDSVVWKFHQPEVKSALF